MTPEEHTFASGWDPESTDAPQTPVAPAMGDSAPEPFDAAYTGRTDEGLPDASMPRFLEEAAPVPQNVRTAPGPAHFADSPVRQPIGEESPEEAETLFPAAAGIAYEQAAHFETDADVPNISAVPVTEPTLSASIASTASAAPLVSGPEPIDASDLAVDGPVPADQAPAGCTAARPDTTAEIDVAEVKARLSDPGSTQSFSPIPEERINTDSTYDAGTSTSLMWGARSDVGCVRTHNEDSYLVKSPLFCVCDGMGGHAAGEVASSIAVETVARLAPQEADPAKLASAVEAANAAIIEAAANGLGKPGMGCTATAAYIQDTSIAIAHVGDSRAYLLHDGTLVRITHDHSYVEELVDAGEITADEARVHPNRSVITRALGSDPAMYADHFQLNIEEGDRLILCSDGLSSMISDGEIETIATQSPTAQICTDNLVDAALAAGGGDNVTVVVVDVVDDGRMRDLARRRKRNLLIAVIGLLVAVVLACSIGAFMVLNSIYLGVKDGHVAIYTGVPEEFMGIQLYQLYDETAIDISDLPEDTQNRLKAGISQANMDEARETISEYRVQIEADMTRAAQDAAAVRGEANGAAIDAAGTTTEGGES